MFGDLCACTCACICTVFQSLRQVEIIIINVYCPSPGQRGIMSLKLQSKVKGGEWPWHLIPFFSTNSGSYVYVKGRQEFLPHGWHWFQLWFSQGLSLKFQGPLFTSHQAGIGWASPWGVEHWLLGLNLHLCVCVPRTTQVLENHSHFSRRPCVFRLFLEVRLLRKEMEELPGQSSG